MHFFYFWKILIAATTSYTASLVTLRSLLHVGIKEAHCWWCFLFLNISLVVWIHPHLISLLCFSTHCCFELLGMVELVSCLQPFLGFAFPGLMPLMWFNPSQQRSTMQSLNHCLPPTLQWRGEMEKKRKVKLMAWDKSSFISETK